MSHVQWSHLVKVARLARTYCVSVLEEMQLESFSYSQNSAQLPIARKKKKNVIILFLKGLSERASHTELAKLDRQMDNCLVQFGAAQPHTLTLKHSTGMQDLSFN